jgi:predicted Zn finger-like uncharacterized protein
MQISCPSCKTRISVPDDKIKPEGTKVKCGKCTKIFTVKKKAPDAEGKTTPAPVAAGPAAVPKAPAKPSAFGGETASELDDLFGSDLSPAPAAKPAPAIPRDEAPREDKAAIADNSSMLNDPFAAKGSVPDTADDSSLGGDNFGAEMDNFKTQLRPMGGGRNSSMFGASEDLDENALKSPARDTSAASLFGSSGDLSDEPEEPPRRSQAEAPADDLDDLFGARNDDDAPPPPVRSKPKSVMPPKESLDDLFGKGLDDDKSDAFVNQLLEGKSRAKAPAPQKASPDDLFGAPDNDSPRAAARPQPSKLDSLFDSDEEPARPAPKAKEAARPAGPSEPKGPTAEELAATLKLEPALKEEDAPKAPPPKAVEAKSQPAKKKFVLPVKAVAAIVVALLLAGGIGAIVYIPALHSQVMNLAKLLPLDQIKELIHPAPKAPVVEPVRVTASVSGGRLLQGGRGDKLYVLEGSVRNDYSGSRSFIKIRGILLDAEGNTIATREVFAGNTLNDEEIRGLERVKIDGTLNRSVGGGLSNFNVPTGNSIPFQIVFYDVETAVSSSRVEPVSSEPGN